jgi:hypothetical protein
VQTVAIAPADTPPAEAARLLEVLLDCIGCLSTPPTAYLLDPAYRGMLSRGADPRRGAAAGGVRGAEGASSSAVGEVAALLRRLGSRACARRAGRRRTRPGAPSATTRLQQQRPG